MGSLDYPFNPVSLALGAEATFVARTMDSERKHLADLLERAAAHDGTAFIEVYQNCNIFNDGAFAALKDDPATNQILLEHGQQVRFGPDFEKAVAYTGTGALELVEAAEVTEDRIVVHDAHAENPSLAASLARLAHTPLGPTPLGLFRQVSRPTYDALMAEQLDHAADRHGEGDLGALLAGSDTWTVEEG